VSGSGPDLDLVPGFLSVLCVHMDQGRGSFAHVASWWEWAPRPRDIATRIMDVQKLHWTLESELAPGLNVRQLHRRSKTGRSEVLMSAGHYGLAPQAAKETVGSVGEPELTACLAYQLPNSVLR
jgi:hypothetical protein